jgi:NAD-specific glutamate dehydrogenase
MKNKKTHGQTTPVVRGKDFGFFGGNSGVMLDEGGHDTSSSLNTKGKGGNIKEKKILSLLRGVTGGKDGSLDSSTIGDGLIRVDALLGLLAVEEVGNKLDDTRDTSGTTGDDDGRESSITDLKKIPVS